MPLIFYHYPASPFSRSVALLLKYLKLEVEMKLINLQENENKSEEFLKINPQHCVPVIDDNGFVLWESRAILSYLMETHAPQLIPTSPKERAIIDQRMFIELGHVTAAMSDLFRTASSGATEVPQEKIKKIYDTLDLVDEHFFKNGNEWIANENVTVADFAYVATISTLVAMGAKLDKFPRLKAWFARCQSTFPEYHEANEVGCNIIAQFFQSKNVKAF